MIGKIEISVIIPVYNTKTFLKECVDSVLNQTYRDFELLLIDDGSTDGSSEICDKFAKTDKRVKVFHKKNAGVSSARNLGMEKANGEFITFVDSDDFIKPSYLQKLYDSIVISGCDISICGFKDVKDIRDVNNDAESEFNNKDLVIKPQREIISGLFSDVLYMTVWGKLYRTVLLKDSLFMSSNNAEDVEFNSRIFLRTGKIVIIPEPLYLWRKHAASLTRSRFSTNQADSLDCYLKALQNMPKNESLYHSFALLRLYKVILYSRYNCSKEMRQYVEEKINYIKSKTIDKFLKNRFISIDKKFGLLIFYYIPITYNFFRLWKERELKKLVLKEERSNYMLPL